MRLVGIIIHIRNTIPMTSLQSIHHLSHSHIHKTDIRPERHGAEVVIVRVPARLGWAGHGHVSRPCGCAHGDGDGDLDLIELESGGCGYVPYCERDLG